MMDVLETVAKARDAVTVKRVYGDPVERDGVTVIPAAAVRGGGGGGGGESEGGETGSGTGFGLIGRPVGAFVIDQHGVHWAPAIDATRIVSRGLLAVVAVAALWLARR